MTRPRTDYDAIAHLYDSQPYRDKQPDPDLRAFLDARRTTAPRVLDLGCGTGNQLVANAAAFPGAHHFGADLFLGMLREAARKSRAIPWTQADGAALPFRDGAFDYVSDQYSLHHVPDKRALFGEVFRVLAPGGRFVLLNVSPEGMRDCAMYRYFPEAYERDARDFLPDAAHARLLSDAGFVDVSVDATTRRFEWPLAGFAQQARRRDVNSHLLSLDDAAYEEGLRRIERDLAAGTFLIPDGVGLLAVRATRP